MGTDDKLRNQGEDLRGKAKESIGRATDDEELEAQGRADQAKADLKNAGEKVNDLPIPDRAAANRRGPVVAFGGGRR